MAGICSNWEGAGTRKAIYLDLLARRLGSTLVRSGAVSEVEFPAERHPGARKMRLLGLFAKNRVEWFICEQAANAYGLTVVPLYDTLGEEAISFILQQTKLMTVACSAACLGQLLKCATGKNTLKRVICFDPVDTALLDAAASAGVTINLFEELLLSEEQLFDNNNKEFDNDDHESCLLPVTPGDRDSVGTLCYTSGTTGNPKGVILTQGNFVSCVCAALRGPLASAQGFDVSSSDIHISYLPLAHVFERIICNVLISKGARIGVYSGDTQKLLEDMRELQSTIFISVPRLFNRINDKVFGGVKEKSAVAQYLFNAGVEAKLKSIRSDATTTHAVWDALVFNRIKQLMGGKVRYMIAGGAPIDALVQEHMKVLFCAPMVEGYGLTETLGASFITSPNDPLSGHVGGPLPCNEFRLESVAEMEYDVGDDPPRGELLIRGPAVFKGYLGNPEDTDANIDADGWLHTGDVVVLLPNGGLKIIDRKKNIFKLAQGEYIAPEKIENIYQQAGLVGQVFAFGYSSEFVLVGIVVPDPETSLKWGKDHNKEKLSFEQLCQDKDFHAAVVADMENAAASAALKGFEKLKDNIRLVSEAFTIENGLLTPTFKLKRHTAKHRFEKDIDAMYAALKAKPR